MDKAAHAPERAENPSEEKNASDGWAAVQDSLAATRPASLCSSSMGRQPPSLHVSTTLDLRAFQASESGADCSNPLLRRGPPPRRRGGGPALPLPRRPNAWPCRCRRGRRPSAARRHRGRAFLKRSDYPALADACRRRPRELCSHVCRNAIAPCVRFVDLSRASAGRCRLLAGRPREVKGDGKKPPRATPKKGLPPPRLNTESDEKSGREKTELAPARGHASRAGAAVCECPGPPVSDRWGTQAVET